MLMSSAVIYRHLQKCLQSHFNFAWTPTCISVRVSPVGTYSTVPEVAWSAMLSHHSVTRGAHIFTLWCVIPVVCVTNEREGNVVNQHN